MRWPDPWEMLCGKWENTLSRINVSSVTQPRHARLSCMRKLLKPFVLWLLLIAVPFQGYAAATMMCCGSAHAKGAAHLALVPAMQGSMHAHFSGMDHDHEEGAAAVGAASAVEHDADAHHHAGASSKRVAFKCCACASCCVSVAIVQTVDASLSVAPSNSVRISFLSRFFYRFVPETLERPPYRLIA